MMDHELRLQGFQIAQLKVPCRCIWCGEPITSFSTAWWKEGQGAHHVECPDEASLYSSPAAPSKTSMKREAQKRWLSAKQDFNWQTQALGELKEQLQRHFSRIKRTPIS